MSNWKNVNISINKVISTVYIAGLELSQTCLVLCGIDVYTELSSFKPVSTGRRPAGQDFCACAVAATEVPTLIVKKNYLYHLWQWKWRTVAFIWLHRSEPLFISLTWRYLLLRLAAWVMSNLASRLEAFIIPPLFNVPPRLNTLVWWIKAIFSNKRPFSSWLPSKAFTNLFYFKFFLYPIYGPDQYYLSLLNVIYLSNAHQWY